MRALGVPGGSPTSASTIKTGSEIANIVKNEIPQLMDVGSKCLALKSPGNAVECCGNMCFHSVLPTDPKYSSTPRRAVISAQPPFYTGVGRVGSVALESGRTLFRVERKLFFLADQAEPSVITPCRRLLLLFVLLVTGRTGLSAEKDHDLANLERSFWLHASLATKSQKGYWGPAFPASPSPTETDIRNAAKLLTDKYAANRLYLVYHHEIPLQEAEQVFRWWRQHCPEKVTLVPTLVLRMYDQQQTPVFTSDELRQLVEFFQQSINGEQIAVYDVYPKRDQGDALRLLAEQYPKGLIRVGIQPEEQIESPFVAAVQDTWSGFCHGKTNADWLDRGFGAETLRQWVEARNQQHTRSPGI